MLRASRPNRSSRRRACAPRAQWIIFIVPLSCAAPRPPHDWSTYAGPGAEHFRVPEYELPRFEDPLEGVNRRVFAVNGFIAKEVIAPAAVGYRAVVPRPVRAGLGRFFDNALFPVRFASNALQLEESGAWDELRRFVVNTTVGVVGVFDVARHLKIERDDEDLGRTFRKWGWDDSTYLMVPILGPTSTRDGLGYVLGLGLDPATYFRPVSVLRGFNTQADAIPDVVRALRTLYDPYELARLLHHIGRDVATEAIATTPGDDGATETLGALFLVPKDPAFERRSEVHAVRLASTGREVTYNVWLQGKPAPLDMIIPGLGGHRTGSSSLALAESVFEAGSHAVTICSSLNYEFILNASSVDLPGYLPIDAHDTHLLLDAIDRDLEQRYPGRFTSRRLGGISFGGITTLFIAAAESQPTDLVQFDAYLAVNPPLGLRHGTSELDRLFNSPLELPDEVRDRWVESLFAKTVSLAEDELVPSSGELAFSSREARFLIGLTFRTALREVIQCTQRRHDLGVLHAPLSGPRRGPAYQEIDQFSFIEYVYAFLLPYLGQHSLGFSYDEVGAAAFFEACELRSIASALAANERVRVATNRNDFLLAPGDLEWLVELLGPDRVTVFERGGHLGNLYREEIRAVLEAEVKEAAGKD